VQLPGDVIDVGGFLGDVLLYLLQREGLALLLRPLVLDDRLRLGEVELDPGYLVVQDSWILDDMESFIQPPSDLHDSLGVAHQHQLLELFHLAVLILLLEPSEQRSLLVELIQKLLIFTVILVVSLEIGIHNLAHELNRVLEH
jgi:hypothetical protein